MEMNHSGISYHIPDTDRFSGHLRPLGWQNIVDGSGPSQLHGWDGNNSVFRDEPHMYRGSDWDHNRHPMNGRGWETSADMWKGQNGDVNMELPSTSQKEDYPVRAPADEVLAGQEGQRTQKEGNHHGVQARSMEIMSSGTSPVIEISKSPPITTHEKTPDPPKISNDDGASRVFHVYLSKLDISPELADPEVYNQCMSLFGIDQCATVDVAITKHVNLEDGATAGAKSPNTLLSPLFPPLKDSIFQRAMDLYKKQSMEMRGMQIANGEILDIVSASVEEKAEEQVPVLDMGSGEESVPTSDQEMPEEPIPSCDQNVAELPSTGGQDHLEEVDPIPSEEVPEQDFIPSLVKSEAPVQVQGGENSEEPLPVLSLEKSERVTIKLEKLEDADENCVSSLENSSQTATSFA
ncbi:hypothetical protein L1049_020465 [Liquidambar formosana]|uniref:Uncharacterized protein n=1 Tax=Liquidambar formosana TaxID=63359 RepID=A0AAP0X7D1_LIQFO